MDNNRTLPKIFSHLCPCVIMLFKKNNSFLCQILKMGKSFWCWQAEAFRSQNEGQIVVLLAEQSGTTIFQTVAIYLDILFFMSYSFLFFSLIKLQFIWFHSNNSFIFFINHVSLLQIKLMNGFLVNAIIEFFFF